MGGPKRMDPFQQLKVNGITTMSVKILIRQDFSFNQYFPTRHAGGKACYAGGLTFTLFASPGESCRDEKFGACDI